VAGGVKHRFELERQILGATLWKEITLLDGHSVVYQRHIFKGGKGALPVAHHAMIRTEHEVVLSFSKKILGLTPDQASTATPGTGESLLAYPQIFQDLSNVRTKFGETVSVLKHPIALKAEDHVLLLEHPDNRLAWSSAFFKHEDCLFFAAKDAQVLPATVLWMSNRGLTGEPWNSRHGDCLGIEEACTNFWSGHQASISANPLHEAGIKTALSLNPNQDTYVDYAFGCMHLQNDKQTPLSLNFEGDAVSVLASNAVIGKTLFSMDRVVGE
jgi:hypothetical protein